MILDSFRCFHELSDIVNQDNTPVFVMTNKRHGILFDVPCIDLESSNYSNNISQVRSLLRELPEDFEVKIHHDAKYSNDPIGDCSRSASIQELGHVKRRNLLSIETEGSPFSIRRISQALSRYTKRKLDTPSRLSMHLPKDQLSQLGARVLEKEALIQILGPPLAEVSQTKAHLDFGDKVIGVVRLYRQGVEAIDQEVLPYLFQRLPLPYRISVSLKKVSKTAANMKLTAMLNRQGIMHGIGTSEKKEEVANAIKAMVLRDDSLFEVEWLLILERRSEKDLRVDLESSLSILRVLGDVMIETVGGGNSYLASRFGERQHFPFLELDEVVPLYLPISTFGSACSRSLDAVKHRSLLVHREDHSVHEFDVFDSRFLAYNTLICGKTGSGKSVAGGLLSSSLLMDPNILITKIDVGGSYEKECEVFGGQIRNFSLDEVSGLNPFRVFSELNGNNDAISTLAEFLASLIREEQESSVPKVIKADIESSLLKYTDTIKRLKITPSIDSFVDATPEFPRVELLKRWTSKGVFANALKEPEKHSSVGESRYKYYNFKNIHGAANKDYADGIMAAVITQVNLEMIKIALDPLSQRKFVFFCDETKFFIERHADFFLLTTANFRKFGHAVILMAQSMSDFIVKGQDGSPDGGIITNSPNRIYFETDLSEEFLRERCRLGEREIDLLKKNPYRGSDYRSAVLQDDTGTRAIHFYLTPTELWRVTSKREHIHKYRQLRNAVPELTAEEAIEILSIKEAI